MDPFAIAAMIVSVISGLGGVYAIFQARKKVEAEVDSVIVTSAERSVGLGLRQLEWAEREVNRLRQLLIDEQARSAALDSLTGEMRSLKAEIVNLEAELAKRPTKDELRDEVRSLTQQLLGAGITPKVVPPDMPKP